jgi:hypothetical protein
MNQFQKKDMLLLIYLNSLIIYLKQNETSRQLIFKLSLFSNQLINIFII